MKGICKEIFATGLGEKAARLEEAVLDGDLNYINGHNQAFLDEALVFVQEIEESLSGIFGNETKPEMDYPDKTSLEKLVTACSCFDIAGVEAAMAEIEQYQYTQDADISDWLRKNVDMMNYTQIVEKFSDKL